MNYDNVFLPKHIKKELDNDAKNMTIITRFPPEPSGYMHLGHIFAVKLNQSVAKYYKGKFIVRFDDTNPKSESAEYEKALIDDMSELNLTIDHTSYVSDFFDFLIEKATDMIRLGCAYVDSSTCEEMSYQRKNLLGSIHRENSIESNLDMWNLMTNGDTENYCLRLKAFHDHKNSAMRDPVLYRVLNESHHRTHNKYKVYPTYDFACPILDSHEKVTHVFRSKEYVERDDQMKFILEKLGMSIPRVFTYGRLEIENAVLSKRKIKEGILNGVYSGWDDKSLFTFRGMKKQGISLEGIDKFLSDVGFPENMITIEKQKILTINTKIIDKYATRIVALPKSRVIKINVSMSSHDLSTNKQLTKHIPCFARNPNLGSRNVELTPEILIVDDDYSGLSDGEEITLLYFGNVVFNKKINTLITHFDGSPNNTSKKILWLPSSCNTLLHESGYSGNANITVNTKSGLNIELICENYVEKMKNNEYIQLYKMEYYYKNGNVLIEL